MFVLDRRRQAGIQEAEVSRHGLHIGSVFGIVAEQGHHAWIRRADVDELRVLQDRALAHKGGPVEQVASSLELEARQDYSGRVIPMLLIEPGERKDGIG